MRTGTTIERGHGGLGELSRAARSCPPAPSHGPRGCKPHPVVARLGLPLGDRRADRGRPLLPGAGPAGVWAIGDAAGVPDPRGQGNPCPPTAQHALRQAQGGRRATSPPRWAATDRAGSRSRYKTLGVFVDMGRHQAVAETLGISWRGFPAWFLARTYHLALMPGQARAAPADRRLDRRAGVRARLLRARAARPSAGPARGGRGAGLEPGGEERVGGAGVRSPGQSVQSAVGGLHQLFQECDRLLNNLPW